MSPRVYHDDEDRVYACPECDDAADVFRIEAKAKTPDEPDYKCINCGARFDEPTVREPKSANAPYTDDGLPHNISDDMAERIRELREGSA